MRSITRRTAIAGAVPAAFSVPALSQTSEKTERIEFMRAVIDSLRYPPQYWEPNSRVIVVPFADWDYYYTWQGELTWHPNAGQTSKDVIVPPGFVTDLTSVPRVFWSVLPKTGRYAYAAIVHDYLYWYQDRPRAEADKILEIAMNDSQVRALTVATITSAVRLAGQSSWDANKRARNQGEKRLLKARPAEPLVTWADWKKKPGVFAD